MADGTIFGSRIACTIVLNTYIEMEENEDEYG
jgi:hypothetical protein